MREELLKGLTEEQVLKAKACKSSEELLSLAKEEGIELTDEQLEAVSGGGCGGSSDKVKCPKCGSENIKEDNGNYTCYNCRCKWAKHRKYES